MSYESEGRLWEAGRRVLSMFCIYRVYPSVFVDIWLCKYSNLSTIRLHLTRGFEVTPADMNHEVYTV